MLHSQILRNRNWKILNKLMQKRLVSSTSRNILSLTNRGYFKEIFPDNAQLA